MERIYEEVKAAVNGSPNRPANLAELHALLKQEYAELMDFVARRDGDLVSAACDGLGTDDELLIRVICNRTREQLVRVDHFYRESSKNKSRKSLQQRLDSESSGNYGVFLTSIVRGNDALNGKTSCVVVTNIENFDY